MAGGAQTVERTKTAAGPTFAFGKNRLRFLDSLDEEKILAAVRSLSGLLEVERLDGGTFLDAGSGSGLFSLAAMRLGAAAVRSFDVDPGSVACARELKRRHHPGDGRWTISHGSVLDGSFTGSLGRHDIVYSWGVLHQTGNMRAAFENVVPLVRAGGVLAIAIYNDQGWKSRLWRRIKKAYCLTPGLLRAPLFSPIPLYFEAKRAFIGLAQRRLHGGAPREQDAPGMSPWCDWIDWLGGYPFEVAKRDEVVSFFEGKGFHLERLASVGGGSGNNEFVFRAAAETPAGRV